jgi:hypothetical protein
LIPFRLHPPAPRLREGYRLLESPALDADALNRLLQRCGDASRTDACWQQVLQRSTWHVAVFGAGDRLVGFVRVTSDMALNANLWDLCADPDDPAQGEIYGALVGSVLTRLRRDLGGCSISLAAPADALEALAQQGFVIDPGGIRAMGLALE